MFGLFRRRQAAPGPLAEELLTGMARAGEHERRIAELCAGPLRFEGDVPVINRPLVLLAFTNRSGSTLLGEYLGQTGLCAPAGEFLNHAGIQARGEDLEGGFPEYIALLAAQAGAGRALALKASWDQLAMLLRWNIPAMFQSCTVLHSLRGDLLRQAISLRIAEVSGQWTKDQPARGTEGTYPASNSDLAPALTPDQIARTMAALQQANLRIQLLTEAAGLPRWEVSYEAMSVTPERHLPEVLGAAGLAEVGWRPTVPRLRKQAGDHNAALAEAFLSALRARL
ncbi:hypothetical protein [Salipiger sp. PrR002]|uniref:hypothetical protein n=1 Tax=Salipiger sp. PrR002 TaxID=2706489 RepID=UPI0013BE3BD5|nr:hypothetical protein [Salipiger sp. PrR002]NDW01331.1 hypothetical protein [Salipiger sp. PrR002]NDW58880.1 hypothetical protein [Salipiger sp. PrR004]